MPLPTAKYYVWQVSFVGMVGGNMAFLSGFINTKEPFLTKTQILAKQMSLELPPNACVLAASNLGLQDVEIQPEDMLIQSPQPGRWPKGIG